MIHLLNLLIIVWIFIGAVEQCDDDGRSLLDCLLLLLLFRPLRIFISAFSGTYRSMDRLSIIGTSLCNHLLWLLEITLRSHSH